MTPRQRVEEPCARLGVEGVVAACVDILTGRNVVVAKVAVKQQLEAAEALGVLRNDPVPRVRAAAAKALAP